MSFAIVLAKYSVVVIEFPSTRNFVESSRVENICHSVKLTLKVVQNSFANWTTKLTSVAFENSDIQQVLCTVIYKFLKYSSKKNVSITLINVSLLLWFSNNIWNNDISAQSSVATRPACEWRPSIPLNRKL